MKNIIKPTKFSGSQLFAAGPRVQDTQTAVTLSKQTHEYLDIPRNAVALGSGQPSVVSGSGVRGLSPRMWSSRNQMLTDNDGDDVAFLSGSGKADPDYFSYISLFV